MVNRHLSSRSISSSSFRSLVIMLPRYLNLSTNFNFLSPAVNAGKLLATIDTTRNDSQLDGRIELRRAAWTESATVGESLITRQLEVCYHDDSLLNAKNIMLILQRLLGVTFYPLRISEWRSGVLVRTLDLRLSCRRLKFRPCHSCNDLRQVVDTRVLLCVTNQYNLVTVTNYNS